MLSAGCLCAAVILTFTACGSGGSSAPGGSGIRGIAKVGPTCPHPGVTHRCDGRPIRAVVRVMSDHGDLVRRLTTDAHGRFHVALNPGRYVIVAEAAASSGGLPRPARTSVVVPRGEVRTITLHLDSGIR